MQIGLQVSLLKYTIAVINVRNQPKGELEGPTLAKLIDDKKFPIKLNTNTYIIANKEGKVATVKANEISMDEDYFAKQNIVFKDPSAFGATPLSIDLPDMPMTESGITLEDIRKANPDLFK